MGKTKKETKKPISANAGQAIPKRILMADDNKAIRDVVSGFFEFLGYEVADAVNGIEALAVFLASSFDLVLTDLQMPAMDGLSLTGATSRQDPQTLRSYCLRALTGRLFERRWKEDQLTQSYSNPLD